MRAGNLITYTLNLVLPEETKGVDDHPWQGATEINNFMHGKGHDTRCKHIILHVRIPSGPQPLQKVQIGIVLGNLLKLAPICGGCGSRKCRRVPAPCPLVTESQLRRVQQVYSHGDSVPLAWYSTPALEGCSIRDELEVREGIEKTQNGAVGEKLIFSSSTSTASEDGVGSDFRSPLLGIFICS